MFGLHLLTLLVMQIRLCFLPNAVFINLIILFVKSYINAEIMKLYNTWQYKQIQYILKYVI